MGNEKKSYSSEFKAGVALEAIKGKFSVTELSQKYGIHPSLIHLWKKTVIEAAPLLMEKGGKAIGGDMAEVKKTREKELSKLTQENQWLQKILLRLSPSERREAIELTNSEIPLLRQVKILNVNRSSLYYKKKSHAEGAAQIA